MNVAGEHDRLRDAVKHHKSQVGFHRRRLGAAKAALLEFEARCRAMGIQLTVQEHTDAENSSHRTAGHPVSAHARVRHA